jgi:DNA-binding NtrC family response regulator
MTESGPRVLIVDDESDFCEIVFRVLKRDGFAPVVAHNGEKALEMIASGMPDAMLLDVRMPGVDGFEVLRRAKELNKDLPVLMITGYGGLDGAVQAFKTGAYDYLTKPINNRDLVEKVREAIAKSHVRKKPPSNRRISRESSLPLEEIMGASDAILRVIADVRLVAASDFTVIIQGETGTGKELIAQAIHQASLRCKCQLVPLDCGAIPESLFESELFGYEKGAFTGAAGRTSGKFEMAHGGALFLDEIANMPLNLQSKLLRAIQEKTFYRVGGRDPVTVDVRLIVATNQDLSAEVDRGSFSRDLFYRLSEFTINVPPLRERREDIIHLANRFLKATNMELNKNVCGFSDSALSLLLRERWPGNVRELRSVVRRAVLQAGHLIEPEHLSVGRPDTIIAPEVASASDEESWEGLSLKEIARRSTIGVERRALIHVLRKTRGNKAEAARILHIDYKTIHTKVKQYGIPPYPEDEDGKKK